MNCGPEKEDSAITGNVRKPKSSLGTQTEIVKILQRA